MPDRVLRAGILTSDRVNELSWGGEVFYRRLMSIVDDYGRYDGRPSILLAALFPLRITRVFESDIVGFIEESVAAGLVRVYEVDGKQFVELLRFGQRMRAKASKWPAPPTSADICQQMPANDSHAQANDEHPLSDSAGGGGGGGDGVVFGDGVDISTPNGVEVLADGAHPSDPPAEEAEKDGLPPCPHERIIAMYHEELPMLPRVREWTGTRQAHLRARWKSKMIANGHAPEYTSTPAGLIWWRNFFRYVGESKFLMGQVSGREGRPPFEADLEWLIKPGNHVKVVEGKYHNG